MARTTGTNTILTLSTRRCTGAFAAWAFSTSRIIRASVVSVPTAVVSINSSASVLITPPTTESPADLWTGIFSPVIIDSSKWPSPSMIVPSTGICSPGFTTTISPRRISAIATSRSCLFSRILAVAGLNACNACMAAAVWCLARRSSH